MMTVVGRASRRLIAVALTQLVLLSLPQAHAAEDEVTTNLRAVFSRFGFSEEDRMRVERGAIISVSGQPTLPNELTGAVAMRLPIRVTDLARRIRSGINIIADPYMTEYGELRAADGDVDLERAEFAAGDEQEAARLLHLRPGKEFNFSAGEIASVRERLGLGQPQGELMAEASAVFRTVLAGRLRSYRERGLDGLAGYDRGDGSSARPGDELRSIRPTLAPVPAFAPLLKALDTFPQPLPSTIDQHFYWKKTSVNDRPTFILSHVLLLESPEALAFVLREYYVSHSYNVLQQAGVALPHDEGTVVLAVNSTATDRISGLFSSLARAVGQRRAREALEAYFEGMRRSIDNTGAPGR